MNTLVPYKFQVVAVCQVVDEDGNIVGEHPLAGSAQDGSLEPIVVFGIGGLAKLADEFQQRLDEINHEQKATAP